MTVHWGDGSSQRRRLGTCNPYLHESRHPYEVSDLRRPRGHLAERPPGCDQTSINRAVGRRIMDYHESLPFKGATNMVYAATDAPDLSRVANMSQTFLGATCLQRRHLRLGHILGDGHGPDVLPTPPPSTNPSTTWDVSSVTDMYRDVPRRHLPSTATSPPGTHPR